MAALTHPQKSAVGDNGSNECAWRGLCQKSQKLTRISWFVAASDICRVATGVLLDIRATGPDYMRSAPRLRLMFASYRSSRPLIARSLNIHDEPSLRELSLTVGLLSRSAGRWLDRSSYGPKRCWYSREVMKALTISASM